METKTTQCHPKPAVNATCLLGEKGCYKNGKCHYIGNCEHKVLTNADRIRAMSDEELAKSLHDIGWDCNLCAEHRRLDNEPLLRGEKCDEKCVEHCLEWLKQTADMRGEEE